MKGDRETTGIIAKPKWSCDNEHLAGAAVGTCYRLLNTGILKRKLWELLSGYSLCSLSVKCYQTRAETSRRAPGMGVQEVPWGAEALGQN